MKEVIYEEWQKNPTPRMTNLLKGHEDFIVSHTRENIRQICADNEE